MAGTVLFGAMLLAGCMPARRAHPPLARVDVPAAWLTPVPETAATFDPAWWSAFGDPVLSGLVETALQRNGEVLIAATRVEQAQAQLRLADSARRPALSAVVGAQGQHTLTAAGIATSHTAQPGIEASWEIDLWGRLRHQARASALQLHATQADLDAVALSVAATTAQTYIGLLATEAQLQQARDTTASRAQALRLAEDKVRAGYISQLELTQAQAEYEAVQQAIPQLELAASRQYNALRLLTGELPANRPAVRERFSGLRVPATPPTLPSELLRRRPDVASAELQLAAGDASLAAQRVAFLPQVSLSAGLGALYANALDYDPIRVWSLGGSILAPIFDQGRRRAQHDTLAAQRDALAFAYRDATLSAFSEVENALTARARLAEQFDSSVRRRDVLANSLMHARNRYEGGYTSYLEQLDAQRNLYQAENEVIAVRQSQLQNAVDLYKSLGGGWHSEGIARD